MSDTKTQQITESKGKRIAKTILNTIINILIVLILVTSVLVAALALTSKANNGVATVFGYSFHTIQSPSMEGGNPDFEGGDYKVGDLVIGKAAGAGERDYQLGDIVSYRTQDLDTGETVLICHRIVDVVDDAGTKSYQTKGDANADPDQHYESEYIHSYDIASLCYDSDYHGTVLKGWGAPLDYLRTQQGFFFVVLLPMVIFFMYALIRVVLSAMNYKKTKEKEDKEDAEKEKDEAVKAAVAAALAEKEAQNNSVDNSSVPTEMTAEQMEQFKQFMEFQKMQKAQQDAEQGASEQPGNEG